MRQYHETIKEQERQGIIAKAPEESNERKFYILHKPVIKEPAETTKVKVVFDTSAKETDDAPSLNDLQETGPALQNLLWDILIRNRLKAVALSADLRQAFLQVRIRESDRDVLRFHWIDEEDPSKVVVYRFTRAPFGLNQSPFLLGGTLDQHLTSLEGEYPEVVPEIKESLYVDDVLSGGSTVEQVQTLKSSAIVICIGICWDMHSIYVTIFATLLHLLQTEAGICIQIYVTVFATFATDRGRSMHSYITIFATLLHLLQTEVGICIQIYVTIFATLLHLLQTEVGVCIHI